MTKICIHRSKPPKSSASCLRSSEEVTYPAKPVEHSGKHGWSPERRAKHAAAIRLWAPWAKSTGPKTASGKAVSSQNAMKHGARRRSGALRLVNEALSAQRRYLRLAILCARLKTQKNVTNELLARMRSRLSLLDRIFRFKLFQYVHYDELCKNLDFCPPLRQIVNAI